MTKNLKNFMYNNKAEFTRDLNLIWSNCLEFNTMPVYLDLYFRIAYIVNTPLQ